MHSADSTVERAFAAIGIFFQIYPKIYSNHKR